MLGLRNAVRLFLMTAALLALGGCATMVRSVTSEHRPLNFVGQLSFDEPVARAGEIRVPVRISGGKWGQNSGLMVDRIETRVRGGEIEVRINSALVSGEPVAKELRIRGARPGDYPIFYRDPDGTRHPIGALKLPEAGK